jgi:predicted house-cleaning noncanonical NTP pyrophosphatase (MazG superfamily)
MSIKEKSLKLAAVSLIADEAKKAKDRLRAELQEEMDNLGADRVKAELGDEVVAYITTTKPKFKWEITSDRKFLEWVRSQMPSEIIETVRPSYVEWLLDNLKYVDDLVIAPNGEIVDWVVGSESNPYLTTKFAGDGRETLRSAIVSNAIDARKVLELE